MTAGSAPAHAPDRHAELDSDVDVIVVGYGPVGQTLAALLGQRGHRVAVVERWPELYGRARAGHVDAEVMRVLQAVGAAEAVEQDAHLADEYTFRNSDGEILLSFDYGAPAVSGWRSDYIFYQPVLEAALDRAVRSCPTVQVHQGFEATSITQDPDGVEVVVRPVGRQADGTRVLGDPARVLRARYLVGADGANSAVRSALGVGWTDLGFRSTWLVLDLVPTRPLTFAFDNGQVCDPARPHCLFQLGKHHRRFEFAALPGEDPATLAEPEVAWQLLARYDVTPADAVMERHAVYEFGSSLADRWRVGRAFLAGDAAHLMPPFMGQGMCSGIRDAASLAWRLDLVLQGLAEQRLLETYEVERRPHAETLVRMSIAAGEVSCTFDPVVAAARDEAFRTGTAPAPPDFPTLHGGVLAGVADALAGTLAPQGRALVGGVAGRFDDVVGRGWVLLSTVALPTGVDDGLLERLDGRVVVVDGALDVDGSYRDYFQRHHVVAVLQRPDFQVFGSAARPSDVPALLTRLAAVLPVRAPVPASLTSGARR